MNAPPEANTEYSRGSGPSRGPETARKWASREPLPTRAEGGRTASAALAIGALLGALLILIAQFTALYHLHSATSSAPIRTIGTGGNHAWAPIPLAIAAAVLAYAVYRHGSRVALAGLLALGVATLLIALIGDLPDAHSSGLVGSSASGYVQATSSPSAGLYMETLGAIILIVAGGIGLLMSVPQPRRGQS